MKTGQSQAIVLQNNDFDFFAALPLEIFWYEVLRRVSPQEITLLSLTTKKNYALINETFANHKVEVKIISPLFTPGIKFVDSYQNIKKRLNEYAANKNKSKQDNKAIIKNLKNTIAEEDKDISLYLTSTAIACILSPYFCYLLFANTRVVGNAHESGLLGMLLSMLVNIYLARTFGHVGVKLEKNIQTNKNAIERYKAQNKAPLCETKLLEETPKLQLRPL